MMEGGAPEMDSTMIDLAATGLKPRDVLTTATASQLPVTDLPQPAAAALNAALNPATSGELTSPGDALKAFLATHGDKLNEGQHNAMVQLQRLAESGELKPEDLLGEMQKIVTSTELPAEQRQLAQEAMAEIEAANTALQQSDLPATQREEEKKKVVSSMSKLTHIIKTIGVAILALFGIGIMNGFAGSQSS